MKKFVLIIVLIFGAMSLVQAQENDSESRSGRQQMDPSAIIDGRMEDLTTRLSLTSDQVTRIRVIYEKTLGIQMRSRDGSETADQTQSSTEQRHAEIMELLNASQKEIYSTYLEERNQQTEERQRSTSSNRQADSSGMIDRRVEDLTTRLSLTSDQITKVRAIYEKTMGVRSGSDESSESAVGTQSSSEQRHTEIMALLNADQKETYRAYLEERE